MIPGLMQQRPLQIIDILRFAARAHPSVEIVSREIDEPIFRYNYREFASRVERAARALSALGVRSGDRVASLGWNTHRHLELFYAVPGMGAVLSTVNPRLFDEQIVYVMNHAESEVLLLEKSFLPMVERLAQRFMHVKTYIVLSGQSVYQAGAVGARCYEQLLDEQPAGFDWPTLDENAGAVLCYTSGTTGDPKGVLYSHRAIVLHALSAGLSGALGITAFDVVMPCSSLYHATAWGLPYVALINAAKLVLPADKMDGESLHDLITSECVTISGGVPTIWTMYLEYLDRTKNRPETLKRLVIAGSAVPRAMAMTLKVRFGIQVLQLWGMTETSPMGVVATPTPGLLARGATEADEVIWTRQGRMQFGIELKVVDESGAEVPSDGVTQGILMVRGPWTIQKYYRADSSATDAEGWFNTGDIVTLDGDGYMRITDRNKDVIKSGGEWISSIDLENYAVAYPGVKLAAVVGVRHPRWEERPVLVIEAHDGASVDEAGLLEFLKARVAKWWLPDRIFFESVPLTATGKIDKKRIRQVHNKLD